MISGRNMNRRVPTHGGFSMLDALIAIVVLATGLLALAVLQGAMTRSAADSRARAQVGAFTQSVIDRMRFAGYDTAAPSTIFAQGDTITPGGTCSAGSTALTTLQRLASDAQCAQDAAGVSNLTTTITTAQLYCGTSGSTFATASSCTPDQATYKQLKLTSTWTDSTGATRSLAMDTTLSPITSTPTNNSLTNSNFSTGIGASPTVREANPGNTLGVIPIAVSDTSNAAATNPKPVVTNTGTTFTTLMYVSSNSQLTQITQRVDTKVVQCSCKFGGPASADSNLTTVLKQPYGPTYWDGTKYVSPAKAKITGSSSNSETGVDTSATQDASCDICCRDRNDVDSSGTSLGNVDAQGNSVLFDNYTGNTSKYRYVSGTLTAETSGAFVQACRMIRVDGSYAAATDAHLNFFGLLTTDNCAGESTAAPTGCTSSLDMSDTVPSSSTETKYANFVDQYVYNYRNDLISSGKPSLASSYPALSSTDTNGAAVYVGTGYQLNLPANTTINLPNTVSRWVYARGIYIDFMQAQAQTAFSNAITNCGGASASLSSLKTCGVFAILPFTTVNMSELANWTVTDTGVLHISNTAVIGGDESSPKRGNVTVPSTQSGATNPTANATATAYTTNSGLTAVATNQANSTYDTGTSGSVSDLRQFTVSGSSGTSTSSFYYKVALSFPSGNDWISSITQSNNMPQVGWSGTATQLGTANSGSANAYLSGGSWFWAGASSSVPIPVGVTGTAPSSVGFTVNVQGFNYSDLGGSEVLAKCGNTNWTSGSVTATGARRCYNFSVNAAGITITPASTGTAVSAGVTSASLMSGTTNGAVSGTQTSSTREGATFVIPTTSPNPGIASTTNTIAGADLITIPLTLDSGSPTIPSGSTCSCVKVSGKCDPAGSYTYTAAPDSACP
jgi:Tfp pilus assembly protein PilV